MNQINKKEPRKILTKIIQTPRLENNSNKQYNKLEENKKLF